MDGNTLVTIISSLGFPIVACIACGWYINKQDGRHSEEMNKITEAVNNNTLALTRLIDKIGGEADESKKD